MKQKQKQNFGIGRDKPTERKDPKRRHKNQRSTLSQTQESSKPLIWKP